MSHICHREPVERPRARALTRLQGHRGAALCAAMLLLLTACSGNFGTGTGIPQQGGNQLPPMGTTPMPESNGKGLPEPGASSTPAPAASPMTYQIADAQTGFACPASPDGFGCTLSFNLPEPTPAPSATPKHKGKATPTPSPSPTPTPTPSPEPSSSASPAASSSPGSGTITLKAAPMPADAPKLVHTPPNSINVIPLEMVTLTTNADFPLDGWVNAAFTLPADQFTKDRGFAVQLFSKNQKKKSTDYAPIWTFDRSTVNNNTLTFSFKPPKMKIAKGSTYVLVLYGDAPKASPLPSAPVAVPPGEPGAVPPGSAPTTAPLTAPSALPSP